MAPDNGPPALGLATHKPGRAAGLDQVFASAIENIRRAHGFSPGPPGIPKSS
jgi:hypothetical protein